MSVNKKVKICFVSASGGHYEQLKCLKPLLKVYAGFFITERTKFQSAADYYVTPTGLDDKMVLFKFPKLFYECCRIWFIEKPDYVITTGTFVSIPFVILCKIFRKKFIYIETFARVKDTTKAGFVMYRFADLFIYQWESLAKFYPNGVYGGSIY